MTDDLNKLIEGNILTKDNLRTDSRSVSEGDVFFAVRGTVHDGHDHIDEAISRGASFVVCERSPDSAKGEPGRFIEVRDTREELALAAKRVFGSPSDKLKIYGVTGTNGKTTTVFLIDHILSHIGVEAGFISTVFTKGAHDDMIRSNMTTPDAVVLNSFLSGMVSRGKEAVALEVSSHALSQKRISGIELESAVFTNITPEHLDYHGNMDNYFSDKAKIFANLKKTGLGAVNMDDPAFEKLLKIDPPIRRMATFAVDEDADFKAENISLGPGGTDFDLVIKGKTPVRVSSPLIGRHNVYNMMAASAALADRDIGPAPLKEALCSAPGVPGRLESVAGKAPFRIFVDYAHTPNALENILACLRRLTERRLICVFGCGGDRDRTKRPVMGRISSEICDKVILTNDNPRTEKAEDIIAEIEKGMPDKSKYSIILQRREAIREAMKTAREGDILIIAGKGHEDYQVIGAKKIHFDDKETAEGILRELGY